jgi:hypothetical protein
MAKAPPGWLIRSNIEQSGDTVDVIAPEETKVRAW